jgi:hypothetical protein
MVKMTKHFSNAAVGTNGAFMGFDTSESDDTETSDLEQGSRQLDDVSKMLAGSYQNIFFQLEYHVDVHCRKICILIFSILVGLVAKF